jgi:suppressor for copper-sensitivity B
MAIPVNCSGHLPPPGKGRRRLAPLFVAFALLLSAFAVTGVARAAGSDWARTEQTELRLISAVDAVGDSRTVTLGLHFRMKPGWKIYWRSPGDAGYPPSIDWKGSANLDKASLLWPAPHRFDVSGLTTVGYKGEVVLPLSATLMKAGDALSLRASVEYLTCDDVCIPYTAKLSSTCRPAPAHRRPRAR